MRKSLGILALLAAVCVLTALAAPSFLKPINLENLLRRTALFGILGIGAALVIVARGIDLSIGSLVCLVGCLLPLLVVGHGWPPALAIAAVLLLSTALGAAHGWLVTRLSLQPFLVTLCGLLVYRGVARGLTGDQPQGFRGGWEALRALGNGRLALPFVEGFELPVPCLVLAAVALAAAAFLDLSVWGRWLRAIGRNETAVRYAGVDTGRIVRLAYALCGLLAGLGGMLFVFDLGSAQAVDFGAFYELYAIAAAVLGGCSLRGGEGTILGVVLGAALMQVLRNSITLIDEIPDHVEFAVIGLVILLGVVTDELIRRSVAARAARRESAR